MSPGMWVKTQPCRDYCFNSQQFIYLFNNLSVQSWYKSETIRQSNQNILDVHYLRANKGCNKLI